jgi:hypothetical protein
VILKEALDTRPLPIPDFSCPATPALRSAAARGLGWQHRVPIRLSVQRTLPELRRAQSHANPGDLPLWLLLYLLIAPPSASSRPTAHR